MTDLQLVWDPHAPPATVWGMDGADRPSEQYDLEEYFRFLADVEPGCGTRKEPADLFDTRFTL